MADDNPGPDFAEEDDTPPGEEETRQFSQAVLYASDWTVETIVSQLEKGNIELNPQFQRRDAWSTGAKSRFVESVVLGLPIPQIVLAERKNQRGRYIVLDGKQRLLSLLQFTGKFAGPQNAFRLSSLQVRKDLSRKRYKAFLESSDLQDDLNAFNNHTIRTVVIRNWPSMEFLHLVFLRLNTGSLKLSPQELRLALVPGEFSRFIDTAASESQGLKRLLGRETPDPRMRDVELLVRFLAFHYFLNDYNGRMKVFLDHCYENINANWSNLSSKVNNEIQQFDVGVETLIEILGMDEVARKPGSRSFNRAIFDALIFYSSNSSIRIMMLEKRESVVSAYQKIIRNSEFLEAVESDTAGIPNTFRRFRLWGETLKAAIEGNFPLPQLTGDDGSVSERRIVFDGF